MKAYFLTFISALSFLLASSQTTSGNLVTTFSFQKMVFHSSPCFGTCPRIDLEIDSNRNMLLNRQPYKAKGEVDTKASGSYKGVLTTEDYSMLIKLLSGVNIDSLKFPDVDCCDRPEITIIAYYNNKRKYLKSLEYPDTADELISFLRKIGTEYPVSKLNSTPNIEE